MKYLFYNLYFLRYVQMYHHDLMDEASSLLSRAIVEQDQVKEDGAMKLFTYHKRKYDRIAWAMSIKEKW